MRGRALLAALVAVATIAGAIPAADGLAAKPKPARPNVIVIQTDDQDLAETYQTFRNPYSGHTQPVMPNTLRLLRDGGMSFTNYYVPDPLCCPSRTSLLAGSYAKNTGVKGNGPNGGGYPQFINSDVGSNNLATWLHGAGYRTVHIGKFLNFYGEEPYSEQAQIPPGWSDWETLDGEDSTHYFYGYTMNDNGALTGPYGDKTYTVKDAPTCPETPTPGFSCNYQTDVLTQRAVDQIDAAPAAGKPLFLSLDYVAPHGDYRPPIGPEPAPRDYDTLASAPLPRPPSFNEGNVADKPSFIRNAPRLTPTDIRRIKIEYRKECESLRDVDRGVLDMVRALRRTGQLRNTYIFYISDNGFFQGEHRISRSKFLPYEPSTHLPLFVRGPGIKRGSKSNELSANIDIAPTILKLAGAHATRRVDGRALQPDFEKPGLRTQRPLLLEAFTKSVDVGTARKGGATTSIEALPEDYYGIRVGPYKYVEYADGEKELYKLDSDPYELNSEQRNPRFFKVRAFLHKYLLRLENCRGASCRRPIPGKLPEPKPKHKPKKHGSSQK